MPCGQWIWPATLRERRRLFSRRGSPPQKSAFRGKNPVKLFFGFFEKKFARHLFEGLDICSLPDPGCSEA